MATAILCIPTTRTTAIQPVRSKPGYQLLASLLAVSLVLAELELAILEANLLLLGRLVVIARAFLPLLVAFLTLVAHILLHEVEFNQVSDLRLVIPLQLVKPTWLVKHL